MHQSPETGPHRTSAYHRQLFSTGLPRQRWLVLCGEPPPGAGKDSLRREEHLTRKPLPGLVIDKELGVCRASTAAAVRGAARASEAWDEERAVMRWIADPAGP